MESIPDAPMSFRLLAGYTGEGDGSNEKKRRE
jgi:hypothetical protein